MNYQERITEKGLKQSWIAKKLDISQTLLSFYLSGDRVIPEARKEKLKEILA
ncbi:MAG: hypothetical protein IIC75_03310 [Bacteroidetes bacterium]|nr:hypothetical protein [Bacteroidota bacterium]